MVIFHSLLYVYQRVFPRNLSFLNVSPSNIHLVELFLTLPRVGLELHDWVMLRKCWYNIHKYSKGLGVSLNLGCLLKAVQPLLKYLEI